MDYADFLALKTRAAAPVGIDAPCQLPVDLFAFQKAIVERHLRLGRSAIFAGTGLGKTGMQLAWAQSVAEHTGGRVLIHTPLAVAEQTIAEAMKFGIGGVAYAAHQDQVTGPISVTNYDRADRFDPSSFVGVCLDESSILKSHESQTRMMMTEMYARHQFRLCATATPAPNDWTELGNHSEFLGILSAKEMLATFFVHDGSIRAHDNDKADAAGWRLKRHAERDFWVWVASWSTFVRHPRDIGFNQDGYDLPPLRKHQIIVRADDGGPANNGMLFRDHARTLSERISARRETAELRVMAAAEIINAQHDRPWLGWCNLNAESDALERLCPHAKQVKGSDDRDLKSERLLGFKEGKPKDMVSKPSIAGFGMNWQHCADMVFVGLNDSFEQLFQAIRRCWRFGQTRDVNVYLIASEREGAVVANLERKERDYEEMAASMVDHMASFGFDTAPKPAPTFARSTTKLKLPEWIAA